MFMCIIKNVKRINNEKYFNFLTFFKLGSHPMLICKGTCINGMSPTFNFQNETVIISIYCKNIKLAHQYF